MRAEKEKFNIGFGNKFEEIYQKVGKKAETRNRKGESTRQSED